MKDWIWVIASTLLLSGMSFFSGGVIGYDAGQKCVQNQAIQKGYAEIRVINGERKFQWKDSAITE